MLAPKRVDKRILAFYPQSAGIGWGLVEVPVEILSWGMIDCRNNNIKALIKRHIKRFRPSHVVLEKITERPIIPDHRAASYQKMIVAECQAQNIPLRRIRRLDLRAYLGAPRQATKYELALMLLSRFEELRSLQPRRRKIWQSEDRKILVLMAVALALAVT